MNQTAPEVENPLGEFMAKLQRGFRSMAEINDDDVALATTPKTVVHQSGKTVLYRYEPLAPRALATPLLIVYSQIGRYTMMDLQPDRSLVRNLLEAGVAVYMIDWGNPNQSDRWFRFDDYVEDFLDGCVEQILSAEQRDTLSLLGVCEGGVFATCYAALHPERVGNLALAVTPIDFHADVEDDRPEQGYLNRWVRNLTSEEIEKLVDSYGQMPGELTGALFQEMTPVKTLTKYGWDLPNAISGDRDQVLNFLRMEKWLSDRPHHPGEAAKQWLIDLYKENRLVRGEFELDGMPVRLGDVTMPVLNVFSSQDHIVPPATSRALSKHVGSGDYRELELSAGHIGTFVSRRANRLFSDTLADWLGERDG